MNLRLADRMNTIRASEIRELLKLTEQPEIISFAGGLPAPELFPISKMETISIKVLRKYGREALQYSTTEGYGPLREIIVKQRLNPFGIKATVDNIMITSGSQQALDFTGKLFLDKDDVVICESPSYLGAINAFKAYEPKFVEIAMDDNGMIIKDLEKALEENPRAKFIYTIPDFQNPTGITMSIERRKQLIQTAKRFDVAIIEDSPYGELVFEGERYPTIKSFDEYGVVIQLGTFSKTFSPGLRIGWICAEPEIIKKYIIIKQGADLQSSSIDQRLAAVFMEDFDLNEHIDNIISVYKERRDLMFSCIDKYFPSEVKYTHSKGGLFTWVELRADMDTTEILKEALKEKVAFVPGSSFFANGGIKNYFRLNYSNMSEEKIVEGIKRLGNVIKKYYEI
jgi:2-aminoadipate transaminase